MRIRCTAFAVLLLAGCLDDGDGVEANLDFTGTGGSTTRVIRVGTRNMYLGADLTPALTAQTEEEFLAATTAIWEQVLSNDFDIRVRGLADEIAARRPALVGLQEAVTWRTQSPADGTTTPAEDVAYNFTPQLIHALRQRGLEYHVVARFRGMDIEAPTLLGIDIRMTDHDVILAREGVETFNPTRHVFQTLLEVSVLGEPFRIRRGYVTVDVTYRGEQFIFASTHLEAFGPGEIRTAQAEQLAADLTARHLPVILVGDLNSTPGTLGEEVLVDAGFDDVWAEVHPDRPGFTCCWPADLHLLEPPLDERIDYVLTRGDHFEPLSAVRTGNLPEDRVDDLWPSDHAGLFARIGIADQLLAIEGGLP
jgi:endonuclease/exonuclease/phosphatase family metal-dependent hydrolase